MSDNLPQTIGIDISKASLDCHAHPAGVEHQFTNSAKGLKVLIAWLGQWQVKRIAYEATATYHRALEASLADWPYIKLNPERARRFAQATGTLAKTDRIDAMLLARMAATLQPPGRPAKCAEQVQLAELINARDGLVRDRAALKNREKNLTIAFLKRQCRQRLEQIDWHVGALDAEIATLIAANAALTRRHHILTSIAGGGGADRQSAHCHHARTRQPREQAGRVPRRPCTDRSTVRSVERLRASSAADAPM